MISLALKNIWHRRKRYGWLFIELIAVTFISWYVIDRLVVLSYQYNEPVGYDRDRLCILSTALDVDPGTNIFSVENKDTDFRGLLAQIRALPQVERATPVDPYQMMDRGFNSTNGCQAPDGTSYCYNTMFYISGQDFFETFGITTDGGEEGLKYLSDLDGANITVLTRTLAFVLYRNKNPMEVSDSLYQAAIEKNPDAESWQKPNRVVGLVDDVKPKSTVSGHFGLEFKPLSQAAMAAGSWDIAIRLKPGVNVNSFVTQINSSIKDFKSGKAIAVDVRSYDDISEEFQNRESGPERRLDMIFAFFFLFNVCLGVTGTFWMMTRKRSEEVGVLRAYGSSRSGILGLLISEAVILTLVAWLVGCALWLYYALGAGLFMGDIQNGGLAKSWVEIFPLHFAIISGIILVLLIVAVLIGVAGPGYKLSRVEPVDALRDE